MKKITTLYFAITMSVFGYAQKIKIRESNESIAGANHNALVVTLYGVTPSDAEDAFKSYMKMYDGKRTSKSGAVFIDHALIKEIGNNTVDVYAKATGKKGDAEITLVVAFDLGGAYLNSTDHKEQYKAAEKILRDYAVKTTKEAIADRLKDAKKAQSKLEGAQHDLEKDKKDLSEDIANYKLKIKKAEDNIEQNKSDQEKKKSEIEAQKRAVEEIENKLKAVE